MTINYSAITAVIEPMRRAVAAGDYVDALFCAGEAMQVFGTSAPSSVYIAVADCLDIAAQHYSAEAQQAELKGNQELSIDSRLMAHDFQTMAEEARYFGKQ